jgi:hypothetical protein
MKLAKKIALAIALSGLLAGCAVSGDHAEDFYVAPGKYVFYDCKQLAGVAAHFEQRNKELEDLMARAQKGPGGELVSAMAYTSDYYSNLGELKDVRREQAEKKCDPSMTAPPMTPPEQKPIKPKKRR